MDIKEYMVKIYDTKFDLEYGPKYLDLECEPTNLHEVIRQTEQHIKM